ncbi:MAG TPA: hypothetical protein VIM29_08910 [Bacillota bacterium]
MRLKASTTSWVITGLGAAVSSFGAMAVKKRWGPGILGFGLAHVILGLLDLARPTVRNS